MSPHPCFARLVRLSRAVAFAGWAVAAAGCSVGRAGPPAAPESGPETDPVVRRGTFATRFLLTGELEASSAAVLTVPPMPNWQTTIRWLETEGAEVKAGQKVVEFDTAAFASDYGEKLLARDQAKSALEQAEATAASQRADKEFAVEQKSIAVKKARIDASVPQGFVKAKEWQDYQIALDRAKTDLAKAEEDLKTQRAAGEESVRQAKITLDKARRELAASRQALDGMVLTAPRSGILVIADHPWEQRKLQVGDNVWVGLPVARIPDLDTMGVTAKLSDVDDGRITTGEPVVCTLDAYPDRTYAGRIADIMPVAQQEGNRSLRRAYTVRIRLDRSDPARMRPGMSVKVEVDGPPRPDVLLAPRSGLDLAANPPRARLASGTTVPVTLGPCNDTSCVVLDGLREGDRLEVSG